MHPIICELGPFSIYSYGLLLAVAFLVSSALACSQAKRQGENQDAIFNFAFLVFISGVAGARIFYIAENAGYYLHNPAEMIMLQRGGLSWFGGLIAGIIAAVIYLKAKRLSLFKTLDILVPFVALAQAIGRIGCLLNGCCFGKPSLSGLYFETHDAVLIPTQLYSTLILVLIFIVLRLLQDRPHKSGEIFLIYLLFYSAKRFFIEFWRADNAIIFSNLTLFQVLSIAIFLLSLFKLVIIKKSQT